MDRAAAVSTQAAVSRWLCVLWPGEMEWNGMKSERREREREESWARPGKQIRRRRRKKRRKAERITRRFFLKKKKNCFAAVERTGFGACHLFFSFPASLSIPSARRGVGIGVEKKNREYIYMCERECENEKLCIFRRK